MPPPAVSLLGLALDSVATVFAASCIFLKKIQRPQLYILLALFFSALITIRLTRNSDVLPGLPFSGHGPGDQGSKTWPPSKTHPIRNLITKARTDFMVKTHSQSGSLNEAVAEYRRRYGLHPPPNFDRWYQFAVEHDIPLIDEYDDIHDMLRPFWGLSPRAIRARGRQALEADDFLMGVFIRNGQVDHVERGKGWKKEGFVDALQNFIQYLPDMDVILNLHDEARVILPHEDLAQLLSVAEKRTIPKATANKSPRNTWSPTPADVNAEFREGLVSPFNEYAHQFTWTIARLSCPLNSNARLFDYDDNPIPDAVAAYTEGELGFISNQTAFSDICLSPSLRETFGFFNRPNAWCVTHELVPIFSPSKPSSFQDLLVPAPWYLAKKAFYNDTRDLDWEEKKDALYWRGTTTSGYSFKGSWHRQHRQRFIERLEKPGTAKVMELTNRAGWSVKDIERDHFKNMLDVHFTFVGQCDKVDCDEQYEYFDVREDEDFQLNWLNKYLLDIDGNAFSGRFYAFLRSKSIAFKAALFREWHDKRIKPWVHYVPISFEGNDLLEALRYFNDEKEGQQLAREIAVESSSWAARSLGHVDMEAWLFRLLLEYGRVVDDDRDVIGFSIP